LPITLTLKMGTLEYNYPTVTTDASGYFTVSVAGLPNGTYNWRVKGPQFLATGGTVALTGAPVTSQEMGLQPAGDANNSNRVDVVDFDLLKVSFGRGVGNPGYDPRTDFNGDDRTDSNDFLWIKRNFSFVGHPPLAPGGSPLDLNK
jgi:hypothetical protein